MRGLFVVYGLHSGEQQHVADGGAVGEQHDQTVYAETESAGGREPVFERGDVIVIDLRGGIGFLLFLFGDLAFETLFLVDRIVEFGKSVAVFGGVDEVLEAFGERGIGGLLLCERAVFHGIIVDYRRLDEVFFHERVEQFGEHGAFGGVGSDFHVLFLCRVAGVFVGFPVIIIDSGELFDRFRHSHTFPVTHIDLRALIGDDPAAAYFFGEHKVKLFYEVHHTLVIGVRLIQLYGREFGIVLGVHTLVAEYAPDFVNFVETADYEPLEIQLGLNTQVHIHIQRVVVRFERARGGADLERGEYGGVDFQKSLAVEISADLGKYARTLDESFFYFGIYDKVEIPLAVTRVHVL